MALYNSTVGLQLIGQLKELQKELTSTRVQWNSIER